MRRKRREPVARSVQTLMYLAYAVPLLWAIVTSLKTTDEVLRPGLKGLEFTPTLSAYSAAVNSSGLPSALLQSVIIATGTSACVLVLAIPAGYALARVRGVIPSTVIALLLILQMVPQTSTVIPLFEIFAKWHLLNNTFAVILADTALLTPFVTLLLRPFFRSVPSALEEAAAIDGASLWRTFLWIALPIARNGVVTTATLVFLLVWGEFLYGVSFFLTPGKYPLSALIAQQVGAYGINWPNLMAFAVLTALPVLLIFALGYRFLKDGLTVGAVK